MVGTFEKASSIIDATCMTLFNISEYDDERELPRATENIAKLLHRVMRVAQEDLAQYFDRMHLFWKHHQFEADIIEAAIGVNVWSYRWE